MLLSVLTPVPPYRCEVDSELWGRPGADPLCHLPPDGRRSGGLVLRDGARVSRAAPAPAPAALHRRHRRAPVQSARQLQRQVSRPGRRA